MSDPSSEKPKIIVDEDWKSQVQAEKKTYEKQKDDPAGGPQSPTDLPMPEASLSLLVTTLASQTMATLGQVPAEQDEKVPVNLDFARHCIDTLSVLEEKTKGNLTAEENNLLTRFLHELRMLFVAVQNQVQKQADSPDPPSA